MGQLKPIKHMVSGILLSISSSVGILSVSLTGYQCLCVHVGSFTVNGTAGAAPGGVNGTPGQPNGQVARGGDSGRTNGEFSGAGGSYGDVTGSYLGGEGCVSFLMLYSIRGNGIDIID